MSGRLILIEGLPGAGKSSTTVYLGEQFHQQGIHCKWFLEEDEEHPIDIKGIALKDLSWKIIPLWESFLQDEVHDQNVTMVESRLWQNTALFMYMAEFPVGEIIELREKDRLVVLLSLLNQSVKLNVHSQTVARAG